MININFRDPRPIYEQVKDSFRDLILSGTLATGERLPSVREMASSLAINPNTIQRAYRELESEGYIASVPGKGSFVCHCAETLRLRVVELEEQTRDLVGELKKLGVRQEEVIELVKGEYANDD